MAIRLHFAGLEPGRPLVHLAWAAYQDRPALSASTTIHFGRELADAFGQSLQVAESIIDSDVVIYPHPYEETAITHAVGQAARTNQKPCLFFSQDERLPPSNLPFGTLYRSSIFKRLPHERAHAVLINDVRGEVSAEAATLLEREAIPRVGFCGYVGTPLRRSLFWLAGARQKVAGLSLRARVLRQVLRDRRLCADFIARADYLGFATLAAFNPQHSLAAPRKAFLENLFACPYGLALRGKGNHSVRFYEILAAGRIPAFINTDCVLPFEEEIDWKRLFPWIEHDDIPSIGDRILEFHNSIESEEFKVRQAALRSLWESRLTAVPYFSHILHTVASGARPP